MAPQPEIAAGVVTIRCDVKSAFFLMTFSFAIVAIWHSRSEPHARSLVLLCLTPRRMESLSPSPFLFKGNCYFPEGFHSGLLLNGFYCFVVSQKLVNLVKSRYLEPRRRAEIAILILQKKESFKCLCCCIKSAAMCYSALYSLMSTAT